MFRNISLLSLDRWLDPSSDTAEVVAQGTAAEILQEICGWDTIEAPDKVWTVRHTVKYIVDTVLLMNALIIVRKGTLVNDPNTIKVK